MTHNDQSSPSGNVLLSPPQLYADVSSVCAVGTPVQGPETPSPQLPGSAQGQLASPWTFFSSEITERGGTCICFKVLSIKCISCSFGLKKTPKPSVRSYVYDCF